MTCVRCGRIGGLFFVPLPEARYGPSHLGPCVAHGMGKDAMADLTILKIAEERRGQIAVSATGSADLDDMFHDVAELLEVPFDG